MNEIEKMMQNAGLSNVWVENYHNGYCEHRIRYDSYKRMINSMMKANDWTLTEAQEVAKSECRKEYPPFTAEKQIELIKWLAINKKDFGVHYRDYNEEYCWVCGCEFNVEDYLRFNEDITFEKTLAGLINAIWQSLTEEERKQIKNILEE